MNIKEFENEVRKIKPFLVDFETNWDARDSIIFMRDHGSAHWKQMEWIGFYFQYMCEQKLRTSGMRFQVPTYGHSSFDGLLDFPWDFKAHPVSSKNSKLITNDSEATALAIQQYGATGLILASGLVTYNDVNGSFKRWHEEIKGGQSPYEVKRIQRGAPSRLRKTHFMLQKIEFIRINDATMLRSGSFQEGFRNSNGSPRRRKVLLDLAHLPSDEIIDVINY